MNCKFCNKGCIEQENNICSDCSTSKIEYKDIADPKEIEPKEEKEEVEDKSFNSDYYKGYIQGQRDASKGKYWLEEKDIRVETPTPNEKIEEIMKQIKEIEGMACPIHGLGTLTMSDCGETSKWCDFCTECAEEDNDEEPPELIGANEYIEKLFISFSQSLKSEVGEENELLKRKIEAIKYEVSKPLPTDIIVEIVKNLL